VFVPSSCPVVGPFFCFLPEIQIKNNSEQKKMKLKNHEKVFDYEKNCTLTSTIFQRIDDGQEKTNMRVKRVMTTGLIAQYTFSVIPGKPNVYKRNKSNTTVSTPFTR
jgi:hypothetical protein